MSTRLDNATLRSLRHVAKQRANQTPVRSKARSIQRELEAVIVELEQRVADLERQLARTEDAA